MFRTMLLLSCVAASLGAQTTSRRASDGAHIAFPFGAVSVPLVPGLRPVIDIMIDGIGPFRMLVETGAINTAMTPAGFARLVPPSDTLSIRRRARATDSARVGSAVFTRLLVRQVATLGVPGVDGILALDAFRHVLLSIDFPRATLTLSPDTLPDANDDDILTLGSAANFWTVPVVLPSGKVHAILDTQSVLSLSAMPDAVKSFTFTSVPAIVGRARGPTVGDVPLQRARLAGDATIGAYTLQQPLVDLFPFPPQLPRDSYILGLEILRNFTVSLDQRNGRIRFTRANKIVPPPPPAMSTGFATVLLPDGTRRVAFVATGQAADAAGVKVGDIVLRMNDAPIASVEDDVWRRAMSGKDPVRFQLRRLNCELDVTILPTPVGF